jgi:4-amino-4-deoxychorismate lyase
LFETIAWRDGKAPHWQRHLRRLQRGCERLHLPMPPPDVLAAEARRVCAHSKLAVLKIIVTRGSGGRGYRPPEHPELTRVVVRYPWPEYPDSYRQQGISMRMCDTPLARNPVLAGLKHLNRLEQVLARAEWQDTQIAEGVMCDTDGDVIEGTMTNIFLVQDELLLTPDLGQCGVAGVMREIVLENAAARGIPCRIGRVSREVLYHADEVFVCNSIVELWPVRRIGQYHYAPGPVTRELSRAISA